MPENPWSAVENPTSALGPLGSSFGPSGLAPVGIHHLLPSNLTSALNTMFTKQESKLVSYMAVDYFVVRQEDKAKVRNVKVIPGKQLVPKHELLVVYLRLNSIMLYTPFLGFVDCIHDPHCFFDKYQLSLIDQRDGIVL